MIDLHCHMLTAVDDGSQTIDLSITMAKEAYEEGIDKILLTPHHMDGQFVNHKLDVEEKVNNLQKILYDNQIYIDLRPGQEVHINGGLLDSIDNDDILYADGSGKKYIMLELPHTEVPKYTFDMIFEMKVRGITPIIVHPERNAGIRKNPELIYDLVKQGCLTQLTATSYVGGFGKSIQKFTDQLVDAGLGFMLSSDAHNLEGRRFRLEEAFERLREKKGDEIVEQYKSNAKNVWESKTIIPNNIRKISNKSFFKKVVKKFF